MVLWDYAIELRTIAHKAVSYPCFQDQDKITDEYTFGKQSNMDDVYKFGWHDWVCYRDHGSYPKNKEKLGRVLRTHNNEVKEMSQSIVASRGYVITRRTVRSLITLEIQSET